MYNSPTVLLKGIQARFLRGLATQAPSVLSPFYEEANSQSDKETYILFDHFGIIKEWVDKINFSHIEDFDYTIKNKDWQNGFLVKRNTLDDSRQTLGNDIEREIKFSLDSWGNFPDKLITTLITAGESGLCFDGTALFANDRPNLKGDYTIDNLLALTGITLDNIMTDIAAGMVALRGFKAKNGDPFNYNPKFMCMIPSHLELLFKRIKNSTEVLSGSAAISNVLNNSFDYVVNDYLSTSDNSWYMMNANSPFKPFIYQTRKAPAFNMKDDLTELFIQYFSTGRMNAGYGNPVSIVKFKA